MYIANKMSILIGMPSMRQLRIRKSKPQNIIFPRFNSQLCLKENYVDIVTYREISLKLILKRVARLKIKMVNK